MTIRKDSGKVKSLKIAAFVMAAAVLMLSGCGSTANADSDENDTSGNVGQAASAADDYAAYIKNSMDTVSIAPEETEEEPETERDIHIFGDEDLGDSVIRISSMEELPEDSGVVPNFSSSTSSDEEETDDDSSQEDSSDDETTDDAEASDGTTPDDFPVGTCCIYISGSIDDQYGADLITAVNQARTDLGYTALTEKTGLDTCANRRTREIASYLNHMRPNGTPFYSLAPDYFKAEMLAIDGATAEETVDAWIRDPYSRSLLFTTKYTSIGAACFECNGLECVVVALGP